MPSSGKVDSFSAWILQILTRQGKYNNFPIRLNKKPVFTCCLAALWLSTYTAGASFIFTQAVLKKNTKWITFIDKSEPFASFGWYAKCLTLLQVGNCLRVKYLPLALALNTALRHFASKRSPEATWTGASSDVSTLAEQLTKSLVRKVSKPATSGQK